MYGASAEVDVIAVERDKRILIEWDEPRCPVEWLFTPRPDGTLVQITTHGFTGSEDEIVVKALDSMGGFTHLLASLKALLEQGVELNLVADHYPDAHLKAGS